MVPLWMLLLGSLSTFNLGVFIWVVIQHFVSVKIPAALQHPIKLRFMHCMALYTIALVSLLSWALWFSGFISVVVLLLSFSPP